MSIIKIIINGEEVAKYDSEKDKLGFEMVIQEAKEQEKNGLWRPERESYYWVLNDDSRPEEMMANYSGTTQRNIEYGNCFRTEAEAQAELNKRKALTRIKDYIARKFGEWEPNWKSSGDKWVIGFDCEDGRFFTECCTYNRGFIFAVEIKSQAVQLIKACESDLRILFDVN